MIHLMDTLMRKWRELFGSSSLADIEREHSDLRVQIKAERDRFNQLAVLAKGMRYPHDRRNRDGDRVPPDAGTR